MTKKIVLSSLLLSLLLASCKKQESSEERPAASTAIKVGLVFDVGGRGDKSFNDAAFRGLEEAKTKLGVEYEYIEPGPGADREAGLRQLASRDDVRLIFGVGFIFTDDITNIAKEFPDKKFACIDYSIDSTRPIPQNLLAVEFKEEEGSFLVGALAALVTKTNTIGFIGGMQSPLIKKFEVGYILGARYANEKCKVLVGYAGLTGDAFKNPGKGKEIALGQYNQGADVIYHASGVTGLGVFEAAREKKRFAIGVDSDQYHEAPGFILSSMTKIVDTAVFETIRQVQTDSFSGGRVVTFDLRSKGVDYVYDGNNKRLIPDEVRAKVEILRNRVIAGEILVPNQ